MKVGVWLYGFGTVLTGMLALAWRAFDASHQPVTSLGNVPGQYILACLAGIWLVAAGLAMLWRRSERIGAAASAAAYLIFLIMWLPRYYTGIHAFGWRIPVLLGVSFGVAQQLLLVAPAVIVYASLTPADSRLRAKAIVAARWMLGLPPIVFGLFHLFALHVFASIVPQWIPFGNFWAASTGIAFLLGGVAICSGIKDVLAARLLALMLLLFETLVEAPPISVRLHN